MSVERRLTCQQLVELRTDYLENGLDGARRAEIERHIVICGGCSNYAAQMRSTVQLLARLADDDPDGDEVEPPPAMFRGRAP